MDSLVFIATLGVGVAVIFWFVANEARSADASVGLFALKGEEAAKETAEAGPRYRARARLAPGKRSAHAPGAVRAYRVKRSEKPSWRAHWLNFCLMTSMP